MFEGTDAGEAKQGPKYLNDQDSYTSLVEAKMKKLELLKLDVAIANQKIELAEAQENGSSAGIGAEGLTVVPGVDMASGDIMNQDCGSMEEAKVLAERFVTSSNKSACYRSDQGRFYLKKAVEAGNMYENGDATMFFYGTYA